MKYWFLILLLTSSTLIISPLAQANSYAEQAEKRLENMVRNKIKELKGIANSTDSKHDDNIKPFVLSTHIRSFSDIPKAIDADIAEIRQTIRLLIRVVATDIEVSGGHSGALTLTDKGDIRYEKNPNLSDKLNEKREQLLKANLSNSVSVHSAALAIKMLTNINKTLKQQAGTTKNRKQKEKIYMTQAIYIYEMADIVLELIDSVTLDGKSAIDKLHQDTKKRVDARVKDIAVRLNETEQLQKEGLLNTVQADKERESLRLMARANTQTLEAWNDLQKEMTTQQNILNTLKSKQRLIKHKRDMAKTQLETLRDLRQFAELRDAIGSMDDLVAAIAGLDLLILDERTVQELLGYSSEE
ncbi:hypothetical protein QUF61_04950 [Candidatus Venteria ishoeyi]|uniref:hypothetical protein n=1 Tax=Candidatus Venteria ishoeyi TaxID=1899563 RepID=UPI0025A51594|nr:hypothetical protein [Candidatus Venteria ishoeyi]MDM8545818.1 hypothetical protein [Candidatus Venteria ishoeyi]